ncbi:MAG: 4Fe-4S cluster-binding domain-containing protein [Archaeoglobaceae archaeon]|nr:4Fe-4S cluster-binding domain-containing protein [Archaeoglobaceae archaeon]MCX8152620.1 4Fe-4S cluster-binding domain-containing protein [Archaeoglobaceae archaeon]MDW8014098.1 4Fe-4S cluster-binding domain-containing protein [Archaeoglobaceae archaeon]
MPKIEAGSYYTYLPEGCRICRKGSKLVLFITGECRKSCFYCPISLKRRGFDVIYANERPIKSMEDFIAEAEAMSAEGLAITGGEPLLKLKRVFEFLDVAKKMDLHVHIYTSIAVKESLLRKLKVDEIRFHPPELKNIENFRDSILAAKKLGIDSGFEIPAIYFDRKIVEIVNELDAFLNVNQLEVSESNYKAISSLYTVKDYYVENPEVIKAYEEAKKFHYCSAKFKDVAQFRRRLIRMGMNMPEFYLVTSDGTVLCARIDGDVGKLRKAEKILQERGFEYIKFENFIETSVEIVEKIGELLKAEKLKVYLVERYPTYDATLVESVEI